MLEKTTVHLRVISMITISLIGLIVECLTQNWEFWMAPLLFIGILIMWIIHLDQYGSYLMREKFYLGLAMIGVFFHGVHSTSFFDIAVITMLLLATMQLLVNELTLHFVYGEYLLLTVFQAVHLSRIGEIELDSMNISRIILHLVATSCLYYICLQIVRSKQERDVEIEANERYRKEADDDMDDFLVNISHELRTPVNVVNGISNLILKKHDDEEVSAIRDAGLRLSCQIEDIQDYTEVKRKDLVIENENYMITSLINDVFAGYRLPEGKEDLELVIDLHPRVPYMMKGDIKKLNKVIRHLLDNAVKFTKCGGVLLRISVLPRDYGVNLEIIVSDTGIGMSRKEIAKVSKGYYQTDKKRDRSTGGIGLGLSIVYGFVHKMNGFVNIDSTPDEGTTVGVCIPQEVVDSRPCLSLDPNKTGDHIFYVNPEKFDIPEVREFYRLLGVHIAAGLELNLYSAVTVN
ncbi:MAG: HAMP domain-containing histidine kinase, partial [Lachnospiraceae bacterium]|nr:HAMP domain-containing histidine kinase [Lachnospiraceae bacterium]